jgi:hypothetical protein
MARIDLDDESIPLWVRIKECMRMCDVATIEAKKRGAEMVEAEAAYYTAKAEESFRLLNEGYANTLIQSVIKGIARVSEAMKRYHAAEVSYKNAVEAIQVWKLKLRVLEAEYEREWNQTNRM